MKCPTARIHTCTVDEDDYCEECGSFCRDGMHNWVPS